MDEVRIVASSHECAAIETQLALRSAIVAGGDFGSRQGAAIQAHEAGGVAVLSKVHKAENRCSTIHGPGARATVFTHPGFA